MQEVTNQVTPLTNKVERMDRTLRSLYRNGGEGAPGYLETAREIDNGRFDMIFRMFQEFKDDLKPLKKFMNDHIAQEDQKETDLKEHNRRMNMKLVVLGLAFSAISVMSANMQGCRNAAHSFLNPTDHSAVQLPQDSRTPVQYQPR